MKDGDIVQAVEAHASTKRVVLCSPLDLLRIISVSMLPVLLVEHYDTKERFAIAVSKVTSDLHPKNKAKLKNVIKGI